jgi:hypothetical protein
MTQKILELAPGSLNGTKLAIEDLTVGPGVARTLYSHSGNRFASILNVEGGDRTISFRTPFWGAFSLIGFSRLKLTSYAFYLSRFLDMIKDPASVHTKFANPTNGTGMAVIAGASVNQRGVLMADISVVPLYEPTGMTDPIAITHNNAPFTLDSEPVLHTLGPCVVEGERLDGIKSSGFNLNHGYTAEPSDGELYPRTADLMSGEPQLVADHEDPATLLTELGLNGVPLSSGAIWYYRAYSAGLVSSTGISITAASGRCFAQDMAARHRARARQGVVVDALSSSDGTHPLAVASGVSIPD